MLISLPAFIIKKLVTLHTGNVPTSCKKILPMLPITYIINTNHNFLGITNYTYMGHSYSWDAESHSASQEIPCPVRNMKVHHCAFFHNGDITECTARPRWLPRVSLLSSSTHRNIPGSHLRDICSKSSTRVIFIKRFSFRNRNKVTRSEIWRIE